MKSAARGKNTSNVEVTNVSQHGFWMLIEQQERFLAFDHFPWFRDSSIGQLCNVELLHPNHLYWPDLDIDLAGDSIHQPERYPLISRPRSPKRPSTKARDGA